MAEPNAVPAALRFDEGFGLGEDAFAILCERIQAGGARRMVEFGSGVSTARLLRAFPDLELISIDCHEPFFARTQALIQAWCPEASVKLLLRPLKVQRFGAGLYWTYRRVAVDSEVDVVLVDGPPGETRRGREACLYMVYARLRVGAIVVMDDYQRAPERQMVQNWLDTYPGAFALEEISAGHGLAILTKVQNIRPRRLPWRRTWDNWRVNARFVNWRLRAVLKRWAGIAERDQSSSSSSV